MFAALRVGGAAGRLTIGPGFGRLALIVSPVWRASAGNVMVAGRPQGTFAAAAHGCGRAVLRMDR